MRKIPAKYLPEHPRSGKDGRVPIAVLVVEKVLRKFLPSEAIIHHIDECPQNNKPGNLVACENKNYHQLLHARKKAYEACGHANWKHCSFCDTWDDPINMACRKSKNSHRYYHTDCINRYNRERRATSLQC